MTGPKTMPDRIWVEPGMIGSGWRWSRHSSPSRIGYVRADIVDEIKEALEKVYFDWDGEPEDMFDVKKAIDRVRKGKIA